MTAGFQSTPNKDIIRNYWNYHIIKAWAHALGQPLTYFGLPGPQIADVVMWRDFIGSSTGIESIGTGKKQKEELKRVQLSIGRYVDLHNISQWQLLLGDIEDIVIHGISKDGTRPRHSSNDHPLQSSFYYTLVNFDFCGGIGYKSNKRREAKRPKAIRKLIERQRHTNFLFLMTVHVRDTLDEEITKYLEGAKREALDRETTVHSEILGWYATRAEGEKKYKLKALVPMFVRKEAEICGFDCFSYPVIAYKGTSNAIMVHFAFNLIHEETILHAFSNQSEADVINMPLLEIKDGSVEIPEYQHPNFNISECSRLFKDLPSILRQDLLEKIQVT